MDLAACRLTLTLQHNADPEQGRLFGQAVKTLAQDLGPALEKMLDLMPVLLEMLAEITTSLSAPRAEGVEGKLRLANSLVAYVVHAGEMIGDCNEASVLLEKGEYAEAEMMTAKIAEDFGVTQRNLAEIRRRLDETSGLPYAVTHRLRKLIDDFSLEIGRISGLGARPRPGRTTPCW